MILHYFYSDSCHNCRQMKRGGLRDEIKRLVRGLHDVHWNPLPNDELHRSVRTGPQGNPYVDKTFGTIDGAILMERIDEDPYTPMMIWEHGRELGVIDVLAIVTGDEYPSDDDVRRCLLTDTDFSARLLTREIFRHYIHSIGLSEQQKDAADRERIAGYPFLVPEWEREYRPVEWMKAFDQALDMRDQVDIGGRQ